MYYSKKQEKEMKEYLIDKECSRCNAKDSLTIDHIVPLNFTMNMLKMTKEETFDFENFQPLCRQCNATKAGFLDLSNPKTKTILYKYINTYCR